MSRFDAALRLPTRAEFDDFRRMSEQRAEAAALKATDQAARGAQRDIRNAFASASLGRLGNAIGYGSDLQRRNRAFRTAGGFSASGDVHIRGRSERTIGAIEAYTEGAEIAPRNGRWLWIATDEIPARAGRLRMTPALYRKNGFDAKIGPLVQIRGINGYPLLIVRNATVSAAGLKRKARARLKSGREPKGQRAKDTIVAFIAIPRTSRAARVNARQIVETWQHRLPEMVNLELGKGA